MDIKKYFFLIVVIFLMSSCSRDEIKRDESERIAISDYSIPYPKSWETKVNSEYTYGFSLEKGDFFFASKYKDFNINFENFISNVPSFRNEYTYTSIDYEMFEKNEDYFNGILLNKDGEETIFYGYYNDPIFLIFIGEDSKENLNDSVENIEKL